ncbi:MAG: 16S rRNA (cytidine(1402)-2'-O)-methyltransferase [Microcoleaceae cyanobacterium]
MEQQYTKESIEPGQLYVVGTPIGNLEDMTFRAVKTLQTVDLIAAEDTRHTGKLLHHFQITTPQISYYQHNQQRRIPELLDLLQQGQSIAIVTDAGMPGISDPGYELVKACVDTDILVVPIPGVSASITALSVSGLDTNQFVFEGFLPAKGKTRKQRLQALKDEYRTIILYESPHRLRQTLRDLVKALDPQQSIVIGRELTKRYETIWRGNLQKAEQFYRETEPKGEFTLVVAGTQQELPDLSEAEMITELQQLIQQGQSRSQASRQMAQVSGWSRRQIYQLVLTLPDIKPPKDSTPTDPE